MTNLASLVLSASVSVALVAQSGVDLSGVPQFRREFRGVWVATVDNIDWPSRKGLPVAEQKAELTAILDAAERLRLNAIVFQVRTMCDALYPSKIEPWSEWLTGTSGKAPSPAWDPLQFAIDGCRARGLELHAWFNPYRARHAEAARITARDHVAIRKPNIVRSYGDQLWLDPGEPAAADHTLSVLLDVVRRYDVDAVHIDDYFYPYPTDKKDPFPDQRSYQAYRRGGGKLEIADWRRDNVDRFVKRIHESVRAEKPWVKFGISPFGVPRVGVVPGIGSGFDQYESLYADVQKWIREGWYDYLSPQLYWPIASRTQSYPVLLEWYAKNNPHGRHLWVGNYASRVVSGRDRWQPREIVDQIARTRSQQGATGNVHFSMRALLRDANGLVQALRDGPYARAALIPASPWLGATPPPAPELRVEALQNGDVRLHFRAEGARWYAFWTRNSGTWIAADVLHGVRSTFDLSAATIASHSIDAVAFAAIDRVGNESARSGIGWK